MAASPLLARSPSPSPLLLLDTEAPTEAAPFSHARHEVYIQAYPQLALLLRHVSEVIAADSAELYQRLVCWLATAVFRPDALKQTAVEVSGPSGSGKTMFILALVRLFGGDKRCRFVINRFPTSFARRTRLVVVELGRLPLERLTLFISKAIDIAKLPLVFVSNEIFDKSPSLERRLMVARVSAARVGQDEYFGALKTAIDSDEVILQWAEYLCNVCWVAPETLTL